MSKPNHGKTEERRDKKEKKGVNLVLSPAEARPGTGLTAPAAYCHDFNPRLFLL